MNNTNTLLHILIGLSIAVLVGTLASGLRASYLDKTHHEERFRTLCSLIKQGDGWTSAEKLLREQGYDTLCTTPDSTVSDHAANAQHYLCRWKNRHGKPIPPELESARLTYPLHAVIDVDTNGQITAIRPGGTL